MLRVKLALHWYIFKLRVSHAYLRVRLFMIDLERWVIHLMKRQEEQ
jgi:hypothetical protein